MAEQENPVPESIRISCCVSANSHHCWRTDSETGFLFSAIQLVRIPMKAFQSTRSKFSWILLARFERNQIQMNFKFTSFSFVMNRILQWKASNSKFHKMYATLKQTIHKKSYNLKFGMGMGNAISMWFSERNCNYLSIKSSPIRLLFTHFTLKLKREFNFNKRLKPTSR